MLTGEGAGAHCQTLAYLSSLNSLQEGASRARATSEMMRARGMSVAFIFCILRSLTFTISDQLGCLVKLVRR